MSSLYELHLNDLKSSGLSDQIIEMMGCYSMRPVDIPRLLGWDPATVETALAFPYTDIAGQKIHFLRMKVFPSFKNKEGHTVKYLQPKDSSPHLYVLPSMIQYLQDAKVPIWIIEGEKKTAKAVEDGKIAIGIGGIWNWVKKNTVEPIDDFKGIKWWRREVYIAPDSDTWNDDENAVQLQRGAYALARALKERGSQVKFIKVNAVEEESHE